MKSSRGKSTYRFFESIRCLDGRPQLTDLHQKRIDRTFRYFFNDYCPIDVRSIILDSDFDGKGIHKCRISYDEQGFHVDFSPYVKRKVNRLALYETKVTYPFKYSNRTELDQISCKYPEHIEPLLINNERIRETTYGNIIVKMDGKWFTPLYPLFYGVMRTHELRLGRIEERDLFVEDLWNCSELRIINAMMPFENCIRISKQGQ